MKHVHDTVNDELLILRKYSAQIVRAPETNNNCGDRAGKVRSQATRPRGSALVAPTLCRGALSLVGPSVHGSVERHSKDEKR